MARDLFGVERYDDGPHSKQRPLFSARSWFTAGYRDAQSDKPEAEAGDAYGYGYAAGARDRAAGIDNVASAWRANVACGNVQE